MQSEHIITYFTCGFFAINLIISGFFPPVTSFIIQTPSSIASCAILGLNVSMLIFAPYSRDTTFKILFNLSLSSASDGITES